MKRKILLVLLLTFVTALFACASSSEKSDREFSDGILNPSSITNVTENSVFTISKEWDEMNIQERLDSFSVDEQTATKMTSVELLNTIMDYPYIVNAGPGLSSDSFASPWQGILTVREYYPPLDIFLDRPDAASLLSNYISNCEENEDSDDYSVPKTVRIILANHFLSYLQSEEVPQSRPGSM